MSSVPLIAQCAGLPNRIYIKTRTETVNSRYYFILKDGRICFKPNEETTGTIRNWTLFGRNGLPTNDTGDPTFEVPDKIDEITADADELIALSSGNHFYYIRFDNRSSLGSDFWRDGEGVPKGREFLSPANKVNRGFTLGRRNQDVLYWEDPLGNPHHWGTEGISTLYLLSKDGQKIHISDTGLPPDFSREICGPLRGRFIAEGISASASTIFVISSSGVMYTRLVDFDTLGTNPMFFTYSYKATRRDHDRGDDPKTLYTTWALPSEEWKRQPAIELRGSARISRNITILQTGHGNAARQLRVAGTNENGDAGFYWKSLNDTVWNFEKTEEPIKEDTFLDQHDVESPHEELGSTDDRYYVGSISFGKKAIKAELLDLNFACSPATLRLTAGDEHVDIKFHALDAWTYAVRNDPGKDGFPRIFLGTIQLASDMKTAERDSINDLLKHYLLAHNLKPNQFVIWASTHYVQIESRFHTRKVKGSFVVPSSGFDSASQALTAELAHSEDFVTRANAPNLLLDETKVHAADPGLADLLRNTIRLNSYTLKVFQENRRVKRTEARKEAVFAGAISGAKIVASITLLSRLPRVHNLSEIGPTLVSAQAKATKLYLRATEDDYRSAVHILKKRIERYRAIERTN